MRSIIIITLLLLPGVVFPQQQKAAKEVVTKIEYEVFGRMGNTRITVTKDSAISIGRHEKKYMLLQPARWKALQASVKNIKLNTVPLLKSPTTNRFVDGALHCKLGIATKTKLYESQYFDSGRPMKQLRKLYQQMVLLQQQISESGAEYGQ